MYVHFPRFILDFLFLIVFSEEKEHIIYTVIHYIFPQPRLVGGSFFTYFLQSSLSKMSEDQTVIIFKLLEIFMMNLLQAAARKKNFKKTIDKDDGRRRYISPFP